MCLRESTADSPIKSIVFAWVDLPNSGEELALVLAESLPGIGSQETAVAVLKGLDPDSHCV